RLSFHDGWRSGADRLRLQSSRGRLPALCSARSPRRRALDLAGRLSLGGLRRACGGPSRALVARAAASAGAHDFPGRKSAARQTPYCAENEGLSASINHRKDRADRKRKRQSLAEGGGARVIDAPIGHGADAPEDSKEQ